MSATKVIDNSSYKYIDSVVIHGNLIVKNFKPATTIITISLMIHLAFICKTITKRYVPINLKIIHLLIVYSITFFSGYIMYNKVSKKIELYKYYISLRNLSLTKTCFFTVNMSSLMLLLFLLSGNIYIKMLESFKKKFNPSKIEIINFVLPTYSIIALIFTITIRTIFSFGRSDSLLLNVVYYIYTLLISNIISIVTFILVAGMGQKYITFSFSPASFLAIIGFNVYSAMQMKKKKITPIDKYNLLHFLQK